MKLSLAIVVFAVLAAAYAKGSSSKCNKNPTSGALYISKPVLGTYSRTLNSRVLLSCEYGYRQAGKELQATCLKSKKTGELVWDLCGSCKVINHYCPSIVSYPHSELITKNFGRKIHDKAILNCNCGYGPGKVVATCVAHNAVSGKWIYKGNCPLINRYCNNVPYAFDVHAKKLYGSFERSIGTKLSIECKHGYLGSPNDPAKLKCVCKNENYGKWITRDSCKLIPNYCDKSPIYGCKHLKNPGVVSYRSIHSTVQAYCKFGYLVNGKSSETIECVASQKYHGRWNCKSCVVVPNYCNAHPEKKVSHSQTPSSNSFTRRVGSVAHIYCKYGYKPSPSSSFVKVKCEPFSYVHGKWVAEKQCKVIINYCPDKIPIKHALVSYPLQSRRIGAKVTIPCKCGYKEQPHGKIVAECIANTRDAGIWVLSGQCKQITHYCDNRPDKLDSHSVALYGSVPRIIGAKVPVICQLGWIGKPADPLNAVCRCHKKYSGKWQTNDKCTLIPNYCTGQPKDVCQHLQRRSISLAERYVFSSFRVHCQHGYSYKGKDSKKVTCEPLQKLHGYWKCASCKVIINYCKGAPNAVVKHSYSVKRTFSRIIHSVVPVFCKTGFWVAANNYVANVHCRSVSILVGHWVAEHQCHHIPDYCNDKPQEGVHAAVVAEPFKRSIGKEAHLKCLAGYKAKFSGSDSVLKAKCVKSTQRHGVWKANGECECLDPKQRLLTGTRLA